MVNMAISAEFMDFLPNTKANPIGSMVLVYMPT
jgi:hypothetical protein